jgi:hypothetical protein
MLKSDEQAEQGQLALTPPFGSVSFGLNKLASGTANYINGLTDGSPRWQVIIGDTAAESGGNIGSDFAINRFDDAGELIDQPITISRIDGSVKTNSPIVSNASIIPDYSFKAVGDWYDGTYHNAYSLNMSTAGFNNSVISRSGSAGLVQLLFLMKDGQSTLFFNNDGSAWKPGGGSWSNPSSDLRVKNIKREYSAGLAQIEQLRPVVYTYKGNDTDVAPRDAPAPHASSANYHNAIDCREFIGLIAQECETVMPEMVGMRRCWIDGYEHDDVRTLDTSALIYALVNAVKELSLRVRAMEAAAHQNGARS